MGYIPIEQVLAFHQRLLTDKLLMDTLKTERGLNVQTLIQSQIGYHKEQRRYTLPVYDADGKVVDIRLYKSKVERQGDEPKIKSWDKGYGGKRLYPLEKLVNTAETLACICEGEFDALRLNQEGFLAVTSTSGVMSWDEKWNIYFEDKDVAIIFDCDKAGRAASTKIAGLLQSKSKKIIDLGLKDGEDVSDFFAQGHVGLELLDLIKTTPPYDDYIDTDLMSGVDGRLCGQRLKFRGVIAGKDLSPYQIPKVVKATCEDESKDHKVCAGCLFKVDEVSTIHRKYNFNNDKEYLIKFINRTDNHVVGIIRQSLNLPPSTLCRRVKVEIIERQCLEDITIIPELNQDRSSGEYAIRRGLYFGMDVRANSTYLMRGTTLPDPDTQSAVFVVSDLEATNDTISAFQLDDNTKKDLEILRPEAETLDAVHDKIKDYCEDISQNITRIYQRSPIIVTTSMLYHSVLSYNFAGNMLDKGWLEATVIGDTRSGKTDTVQRLSRHFRCGEYITSGENATIAGLIGGLQQTHGFKWTITWSKIPLNDRGVCVIDEADELAHKKIIQKLSAIRSSGIAELVKIHTQRTMARTRIMFIANPISCGLDGYDYGVLALREIMPDLQDLRRIDIAVGVLGADVPASVVNSAATSSIQHKYTSDVMHSSIMRAWNVTSDKVQWASGTEQYILDQAQSMEKDFSDDIPIVLGAKAKIARCAVATAAWLNSYDADGNLCVGRHHAEFSISFLRQLYSSPALGFAEYSRQTHRSDGMRSESGLNTLIDKIEQIDELMDQQQIIVQDVQDVFGLDRDRAQGVLGDLRVKGALQRKQNYYKKTQAFITFLRQRRRELIERNQETLPF